MSVTITNMSGGVTPILPSTGLVSTANYLYALCGSYSLQALNILNNGGGSTVVVGGGSFVSPIQITSADFANATDWNGANAAGVQIQPYYTLQVFADTISQNFLAQGTQWVRTESGIKILLDGFDATTADYTFHIFISA